MKYNKFINIYRKRYRKRSIEKFIYEMDIVRREYNLGLYKKI